MTTDPSSLDLPWLEALRDPRTYPHPVGTIELHATHLSVVALTGPYAYKLKRPVDFGFVDYTTLERRRHFCVEELRLNRRSAPELYLDLVPLVQTPNGWRFGAPGVASEFAVRMRQFGSQDRLDQYAKAHGLSPVLLDALAAQVADLHRRAAVVSDDFGLSYPRRLEEAIAGNFKPFPEDERLARLRQDFARHLQGHATLLTERARAGSVRECHGDLHLKNICIWEGQPRLYDCIEFNDTFRKIDVLSDMAFLFMDLLQRGMWSEAWRLLNAYLDLTGAYEGLAAWPLWVAYRAHVRAKVARLTAQSVGVPAEYATAQGELAEQYLALAERTLRHPPGRMLMLVGLPGSGKSTLGLQLACRDGGILVRSDVERKRLQQAAAGLELYGEEMGRRTYDRLLAIAAQVVAGGMKAILDATYLRRSARRQVLELAARLGVELRIVHCQASVAELEARIRKRQAKGRDASDADVEVLHRMQHGWEPFTEEEAALVLPPLP